MIIDHANGLHERVTNSGPHEAKAARLQILAQRIRFRRARRDILRSLPIIFLRAPAHELPNVTVERSELPLQSKKCQSVRNRRRDLQTVAHNSSVTQKRAHFTLVVPRDFLRIECVECAPIILALVEHDLPAQSRLRAFEYQKLKEHTIVVNRFTPL